MRSSLYLFSSVVCLLLACSAAKSDPPDSGTDTSNTSTSSSGGSNSSGSVGSDAGSSMPTDQASCIAYCEGKYPVQAKESHTLDAECFTGGACAAVCNGLGASSKDVGPDPDAGALCNTAAAGSYPIEVPGNDSSCPNCIAATSQCCQLWIKIFADPGGQALLQCSSDCYTKFP